MDIQTASKYMQHGYRVRRSYWDDSYLYQLYNGRIGQKVRVLHPGNTPDTFAFETWTPRLIDLTADDWELITDGIVKDFPLTYAND